MIMIPEQDQIWEEPLSKLVCSQRVVGQKRKQRKGNKNNWLECVSTEGMMIDNECKAIVPACNTLNFNDTSSDTNQMMEEELVESNKKQKKENVTPLPRSADLAEAAGMQPRHTQ